MTTDAFYLFSGFLYLTSSSIIAIDYLVINDRGWGAKSSKKLGQTTNFEKSIAFANQVWSGLFLEKGAPGPKIILFKLILRVG